MTTGPGLAEFFLLTRMIAVFMGSENEVDDPESCTRRTSKTEVGQAGDNTIIDVVLRRKILFRCIIYMVGVRHP
jgi:hypothetical protein